MKNENYIAFFTVCGFFVGLVFSFLEFVSIGQIIFYTLAITLFFHLFIHVTLSLLMDASTSYSTLFHKEKYEDFINKQISQLKNRENHIDTLLKNISDDHNIGKESTIDK